MAFLFGTIEIDRIRGTSDDECRATGSNIINAWNGGIRAILSNSENISSVKGLALKISSGEIDGFGNETTLISDALETPEVSHVGTHDCKACNHVFGR